MVENTLQRQEKDVKELSFGKKKKYLFPQAKKGKSEVGKCIQRVASTKKKKKGSEVIYWRGGKG